MSGLLVSNETGMKYLTQGHLVSPQEAEPG